MLLQEDFDYHLPASQIAQKPASPRDHSKLMVIDTSKGRVTLDHFRNLHKYLEPKTLLLLNETAVVPCRLMVQDKKGRAIELLVVVNGTKDAIHATSNRYLKPGEEVTLKSGHRLKVKVSHEKIFEFEPCFPIEKWAGILNKEGEMPIPKYIAECPLNEREKRKKYQTVFAKNPGSAAAPTASLHFTQRVFQSLEAKEIDVAKLTLHIGLGTFAPLLPEHFETQTLYEEWFEVPKSTQEKIRAAKQAKHPCITVGTTATRALESWAKTGKTEGPTDLFITPPYPFQIADGLITNFHLPKSSLMMLVAAFLDHKKAPFNLKSLYLKAIEENFRFYSFGDAMLIL